MTAKEIYHMPLALRILANDIRSPDDIPAMCLRDAAAMIDSLVYAIRTTSRKTSTSPTGKSAP